MAETPSGMLNSIGLQGPGIDDFLAVDIPWLQSKGARVVVSISGETVEEYATLARKLRGVNSLYGIEVNISCPNVEIVAWYSLAIQSHLELFLKQFEETLVAIIQSSRSYRLM